ncbi:hypothetical protein OHJ16_11735 [Actinomyces israelii]|uniref:Uncharacterized protein n=1 Tax=Actinomyces israelii TaxID=1659 RepID=A0ABT4IAF3_9ACTO|nr:hypothetical protein [Actinomyces israelii]MCZ0858711.1 hypothetical protein [Actinomyces israelii]WKR22733.1 hypothetical protein AIF0345_2687 [Actinomyces israelii]
MQIAVTPNASTWIVVPEFPPPGWERAEARRRTSGMTGADPRRRANLEELLVTLRRIERRAPLARLLHVGDGLQRVFAVDLSLVIAYDDSSKEGRHATQLALLNENLPGGEPRRLRPNPGTAGYWALARGNAMGSTVRPSAVVVLRKAGLPTVPVDVLMRVWGTTPAQVQPLIGEVIALADRVAPADLQRDPIQPVQRAPIRPGPVPTAPTP